MARHADRSALKRLALLLLCGLVLAGGFLYACGLHFAALRYGYQTETLRRERNRLLEEQKRFLLERDAAASPARLERAARQLGMQPMQPEQIDRPRAARNRSEEERITGNESSGGGAAGTDNRKRTAKTEVRQRLLTPR